MANKGDLSDLLRASDNERLIPGIVQPRAERGKDNTSKQVIAFVTDTGQNLAGLVTNPAQIRPYFVTNTTQVQAGQSDVSGSPVSKLPFQLLGQARFRVASPGDHAVQ